MRITQISVSNLFGTFNHTVPLNVSDRITIIHGPNGFGKTALLTLVDSLFNKRFSVLQSTPFDALYVDFENGSTLSVSQTYQMELFSERDRAIPPTLIFRLTTADDDEQQKRLGPIPDQYLTRSVPRELIDEIEFLIPQIERVGVRLWQHRRTDEIFEIDDIIERYGFQLPIAQSYGREEVAHWLDDKIGGIPIAFIEAQRLIMLDDGGRTRSRLRRRTREAHEGFSYAVEAYSDELAAAIKTALAASGSLSQSLDRTLPRRLIERPDEGTLTEPELVKRLEATEEQRSRLVAVGLLDQEQEEAFRMPDELDDITLRVLSVVVGDTEEKLAIFDELARKIELMQDFLRKRFQYKSVTVDKDRGFVFRADDGKLISPADLSSGEQHQVVLLYELLFKVGEGSLVLIDEPEISLHVRWQMEFLPDLQSIISVVPFDVIIATHSPQIINNRWDLTVKLVGPEND